jgi:hypothetical protein
MGPVGSWGELEAVQGVQVGHRAAGIGATKEARDYGSELGNIANQSLS